MNRNPHAGLPITDDDATIAKALEDVSIPTLMLSLLLDLDARAQPQRL